MIRRVAFGGRHGRRGRGGRRGVAIFLVIMVSLVLSVFAAILWHSGRTSRKEIDRVVEKEQAAYVARGAQQHALLKFRLMPTELYDAVAFSIGKNPLYDFGRPHHDNKPESGTIGVEDAQSCEGPMFFTGKSSTQIKAVSDGAGRFFINVDRSKVGFGSGDTGLSGAEESNRNQMAKLLRAFLMDIATLYPSDTNEGIVVIDSDGHGDKAFGAAWRDPFTANYAVQDLRVLGVSRGRRYDKDSILLTTIASVRRAKQISPVTSLGSGPKDLSQTRRTMSELKFGTHEFAEARVYLEKKDDYDRRMGFGDEETSGNKAIIAEGSGRSTEIATGTYEVSR